MTFADIFTHFIRPVLQDHKENWDNFADVEVAGLQGSGRDGAVTVYDCAELCAQSADCLQYRLDSQGNCRTSVHANGGIPSPGVQSGTMIWRVDALMKKRGKCRWPKWVT